MVSAFSRVVNDDVFRLGDWGVLALYIADPVSLLEL